MDRGYRASMIRRSAASAGLMWLVGTSAAAGLAIASVGGFPIASITFGWVFALGVLWAASVAGVKVSGRFWWVAAWGVAFPALAMAWMGLCSGAGLFYGERGPSLAVSSIIEAQIFFAAPSLATGLVAYAALRSKLVVGGTALAGVVTAVQVCVFGENHVEAPFVQVAVWYGTMLLGLAVWAIWVNVRRYGRAGPSACPFCQYDLLGLESHFCPECGSRLERYPFVPAMG